MAIDQTHIESALSTLGELLAERGEHFEVVVVGGANLILSNLISRPSTKDVDIVAQMTDTGLSRMPAIPPTLRQAIFDVARALGLADDWMNVGPESILDLGLPDGFEERLASRDYGGLVTWSASRYDMICFKLYAAADQGVRSHHMQDLRELSPTRPELESAASWTRSHDPSPAFRDLLVAAISAVQPGKGRDVVG